MLKEGQILFIVIQYSKAEIQQMKPTNPNFGSNFSNDNMAESVKLADYTGSDHEVSTRKQFMKYAMGGREQYDIGEEKEKNEIKFQMPDIKPIKTEQSQVSGIDSGFRKVKGNQGDLLKQLRDQFNMIKKLPANEHRQEQKLSNSSEQSNHSPNDDPSSSSISSSKINKAKPVNVNQRQERLWMVQRKQYEFMLNNCQMKIEELLHNQMEYKKLIHELRSASLMSKAPPAENKYEQENKELQKQLKQEKEKNYRLTSELERLKLTSKQQVEKLAKIESEFSFRSKDENKFNDERRRLEENIRLEKDRYLNCEIERRKFQMENQLLVKEKDQELNRVQRQIEHQNVVNELNIKSLIKKFEDEIEIKDRRYMLLVSEYEKLKKEYAVTKAEAEKPPPQNINDKFFEIFKTLIEDKKNNNPNEALTNTVRHLLDKLDNQPEVRPYQPPQPQYPQRHEEDEDEERHDYTEKLLSEIRILKAEIEAFKNSGEGIDLEPIKRMHEAETAALKDTIAILERKLKNIQPSPGREEAPSSPLKRDREVNELQRRIRELEQSSKMKPESSFSIEEQEQQIVKHKRKVEQIDAELRNERRQKSEAEFQVTKLRKELEFRTTIIVNEKESLLRIKQAEIDRANTNINYWRSEFDNMKAFFEQKLAEKNRLLEQYLNTNELAQIKKKYEAGLDNAKLEYEKQVKAIAERLSNYKTESLEYDALLKRYTALETAYFELQKSMFRAKQINDGVDHLWQIKETQYGNINEIIRQVGGSGRANQFVPSGGGSAIEAAIYNSLNKSSRQTQQVIVQPQQNLARSNSLQFSGPSGLGGSGAVNPPQQQFLNSGPIRTSYEAPNQSGNLGLTDLNARNTVYSNDPRMSGFGETVTYQQPRASSSAGMIPPQPMPSYDPRMSSNTIGQPAAYDTRMSNAYGQQPTYDARMSNTYTASGQPAPYDARISNTTGQPAPYDPRMSNTNTLSAQQQQPTYNRFSNTSNTLNEPVAFDIDPRTSANYRTTLYT